MISNTQKKVMTVAGLVLLIACGYQLMALYQDWRYNHSMRAEDYRAASGHTSEYGVFANARQLHQEGDYAQAQQVFASINIEQSPQLRVPVLFELSQTYIRQAVDFEKKGDAEQRIPLLELAKENYRKILRNDPDNWQARVNLARVLRMLPDARLLVDDDEDVMPERSPQATVQTMGHDRLP